MRLVPQPEPREDVRRHVERVRRGRRGLGVAAGGRERQAGERRIVEGVNRVVMDSRMLRVRLQEAVQNRGGLLLLGEGPIAGWRRTEQRQRDEDLGLGILREVGGELFHCRAVGAGPRPRVASLALRVVGTYSRDVAPLAITLGASALAGQGRRPSGGELLLVGRRPKGMVSTSSPHPTAPCRTRGQS